MRERGRGESSSSRREKRETGGRATTYLLTRNLRRGEVGSTAREVGWLRLAMVCSGNGWYCIIHVMYGSSSVVPTTDQHCHFHPTPALFLNRGTSEAAETSSD